MKNEHYRIDDLLIKYLLKEATGEEIRQVEEWIANNDDNKKHYHQLKQVWEMSEKINHHSSIQKEDAWDRLEQRIHQNEVQRQQVFPWRKAIIGMAAGLLLVITATISYNMWSRQIQTLASHNEIRKDTLSDGTIVTLNKHAKLSYPRRFTDNRRLVQLDGEAFFDVTPNKEKPFIIQANESEIKVLGTSFNVNSTSTLTEVIVATGMVEVAANDAKVRLHPHEKATVKNGDATIVKETTDDRLYNYYHSNEFICNGTPLYRLVDVLSQAYGKEIIIADKRLENLPLTATFRNESLENVLMVISETFNISVTQRNGKIFLQ